MLKIIVDQFDKINIYHTNGEKEVIPGYQSDDLVEVLQHYNKESHVEFEELNNTTICTVAELLEVIEE